ncbi:MAG: hypothetical protein GXW99_01565 [Clostridiales bacterium]|nr:hypothetical protein [Clostridiales bacterium]
MLDWNGNGKIDPVDIGITMAVLDEESKKRQPPKSGCLTNLMVLLVILLAVGLLIWL